MKIQDPQKIEDKSFQIVNKLLSHFKIPQDEKEVVTRVIHATTDLSYAKELLFHPKAIKAGLKSIRDGRNIICDVSMVKAGINEKMLSGFGGRLICFINDQDVIDGASQLKIARAIVAIRKATRYIDKGIVSIGNAPTALFELCDLIKKGKVRPALIIGIPVGFVGALESKKQLRSLGIPYITNNSTKGGSSVAVAITNALLKLA